MKKFEGGFSPKSPNGVPPLHEAICCNASKVPTLRSNYLMMLHSCTPFSKMSLVYFSFPIHSILELSLFNSEYSLATFLLTLSFKLGFSSNKKYEFSRLLSLKFLEKHFLFLLISVKKLELKLLKVNENDEASLMFA